MRPVFALVLFALPALAHRGAPERTLRLQIRGGAIEGLLSLRLPPGHAARRLLAVPPGLLPGDGGTLEERLGRRAAPDALRGLKAGMGEARPLRASEAKARRTPTGGIEAMLLVGVEGAPDGIFVLEAESGARVKAILAAPGHRLDLIEGLGRPGRSGLELRPRPGRRCRVRIGPPR